MAVPIYAGDTVRLIVRFKDFAGVAYTPDVGTVVLTIKNAQKETLLTVTETGLTKETDTGVYHYDYTTPSTAMGITYTYSCEKQGKDMLRSGYFSTK